MVTPTKSNKFATATKKSHGGSYYGGGNKTPHKSRKTPSPTSSEYNCFKTPQNKPKADLMRCASEPMRIQSRRSMTPVTQNSSGGRSPLNFAGPKCLEPPTPMSLPRPPTTWTRPSHELSSARQALSFEDDLDGKGTFEESLSQQLKMLLKVQA